MRAPRILEHSPLMASIASIDNSSRISFCQRERAIGSFTVRSLPRVCGSSQPTSQVRSDDTNSGLLLVAHPRGCVKGGGGRGGGILKHLAASSSLRGCTKNWQASNAAAVTHCRKGPRYFPGSRRMVDDNEGGTMRLILASLS